MICRKVRLIIELVLQGLRIKLSLRHGDSSIALACSAGHEALLPGLFVGVGDELRRPASAETGPLHRQRHVQAVTRLQSVRQAPFLSRGQQLLDVCNDTAERLDIDLSRTSFGCGALACAHDTCLTAHIRIYIYISDEIQTVKNYS